MNADRLGSVGKYYPYGTDKGSGNPANGSEKFTGYERDADTGNDYAVNRYMQPGSGRFMSADAVGVHSNDPPTWNKYAYTGGDPVNRIDPKGRDFCMIDDPTDCVPDSFCGAPGAQANNPAGFYAYCTTGIYNGEYDGGGLGSTGGGGGGNCGSSPAMAVLPVDSAGDGVGDGGDPCAPPPVVPIANPCPAQFQNWINAHGSDATATGLDEANVLALSAIESGWGTGPFAIAGHDFFNLEILWRPGTPLPPPLFAFQRSNVPWIQARDKIDHGRYRGDFALVAAYNNSFDSFRSFGKTLGKYFQGVADPVTFGSIAVAHGENAGGASYFVSFAQTFQDCLK